MHFRRLTSFLLGAWLSGSLFMAVVATENFRSVDRLLAKPPLPAAEQIHRLGHETARAFLRYQVSEQNRWYFEHWEIAQIVMGVGLFLVLLFGSTENKYTLGVVLLMIIPVLIQRFYLTPALTGLGRVIDFVPPGVQSADRARFWVLHSGYAGLEVLKWLAGFSIAAKLVLPSRRRHSRRVQSQVDAVDKAYNGHVNG